MKPSPFPFDVEPSYSSSLRREAPTAATKAAIDIPRIPTAKDGVDAL